MSNVKMVETRIREPKEVKDVRVALRDMVDSVKKALADGFQPGEDIPQIFLGSYTSLMEAVKGVEELDDAYREELAASLRSSGLLVGDVVEVLMSGKAKAGQAEKVEKAAEKADKK